MKETKSMKGLMVGKKEEYADDSSTKETNGRKETRVRRR